MSNPIFKPELTPMMLIQEYNEWRRKFGNDRNHFDLRFGQHICNKYLLPNTAAPNIFYEENISAAFNLIHQSLHTG